MSALVVGSYPPIPLSAAAATVAAVRRAWAEGDEVTVVSPRLSAADLAVPVVGILAGHRLTSLRRYTASTRLVVVMEPGVPVPVVAGGRLTTRLLQCLTVGGMVWAFSRFQHVTLVRVGNLGMPARIEARLVGGADKTLHRVVPNPEAVDVTPLGPPEVLREERARQFTRLAADRLLGRYSGPLRARAGAALRR